MDFQALVEALAGRLDSAKMCRSVPGSKIDRRPRAGPRPRPRAMGFRSRDHAETRTSRYRRQAFRVALVYWAPNALLGRDRPPPAPPSQRLRRDEGAVVARSDTLMSYAGDVWKDLLRRPYSLTGPIRKLKRRAIRLSAGMPRTV